MSIGKIVISFLGKCSQVTADRPADCNDTEYSKFMILLYVSCILSLLALFGCFFNITVTFVVKNHRTVSGKMMIFLSTNDFLFAASLLIMLLSNQDQKYDYINVLINLSWVGSVFWVCCFAHALYVSLRIGGEYLDNSLLRKYVIITVTLSAIAGILAALAPLSSKHSEFGPVQLNDLFQGMLAIGSILYCGFCYIFVIKKLHDYQAELHLGLLLYPLFLIICDLPYSILLLFDALFIPIESTYFMITITCMLSRCVWNCLAYSFSSKIRRGLKAQCGSKSRKDQQEGLLESEISSRANTYGILSHRGRTSNPITLSPPSFVLRD